MIDLSQEETDRARRSVFEKFLTYERARKLRDALGLDKKTDLDDIRVAAGSEWNNVQFTPEEVMDVYEMACSVKII